MIEDIKTKALDNKVPIIKDEGLACLLKLIQDNDYKDILELGTAVGYSSMMMASLSDDIHIDTIERNEDMYKEAIRNIKDAHLDDRINVHFMPIEDFVSNKKYDLIFVDAAKAQYPKYLEQFLNNLKDNGKFFFDNMVFHGLIYDVDNIQNRNTRSLVKKILKFRELVHNDKRFDIIELDNVGDGVLILSRRSPMKNKNSLLMGFISAATEYLKKQDKENLDDFDSESFKEAVNDLKEKINETVNETKESLESLYETGKELFNNYVKEDKKEETPDSFLNDLASILAKDFDDVKKEVKPSEKLSDFLEDKKENTGYVYNPNLNANSNYTYYADEELKDYVNEEIKENIKEEIKDNTKKEIKEKIKEEIEDNKEEDDYLEKFIDDDDELLKMISEATAPPDSLDIDLDSIYAGVYKNDEPKKEEQNNTTSIDDIFSEIVTQEVEEEYKEAEKKLAEVQEKVNEAVDSFKKEIKEEVKQELKEEVSQKIEEETKKENSDLYSALLSSYFYSEDDQPMYPDTPIYISNPGVFEDYNDFSRINNPDQYKEEEKEEVGEEKASDDIFKVETKQDEVEKIAEVDLDKPADEKTSTVNTLIEDLKKQLAKEEEDKKKEENKRNSVYAYINRIYPYLSLAFIKSVYELKDQIAKEYKENEKLILLHRLTFKNVDELRQFVEIVLNHGYGINVDESKLIVDVFKKHINTDGKILTNIFEIANQARLLNGNYEGYRVIRQEEEG